MGARSRYENHRIIRHHRINRCHRQVRCQRALVGHPHRAVFDMTTRLRVAVARFDAIVAPGGDGKPARKPTTAELAELKEALEQAWAEVVESYVLTKIKKGAIDMADEYVDMVDCMMRKDGQPMPLPIIALGLAGEASELDIELGGLAYITTAAQRDRVIHEAGDVLWYVTAMRISLGLLDRKEPECILRTSLTHAAGEICDAVKKSEWHGKPIESDLISNLLFCISDHIRRMSWTIGSNPSEVRTMNIQKLRKRYPGGFVEGGGIR